MKVSDLKRYLEEVDNDALVFIPTNTWEGNIAVTEATTVQTSWIGDSEEGRVTIR